MTVGLGIAFKNRPIEEISVVIVEGPAAETAREALASSKTSERFDVEIVSAEEARRKLRTGRTALVVDANNNESHRGETDSKPRYVYQFDPTRADSVLARKAVNDQLQRAAGRKDPAETEFVEINEPGGRYIDFLVPGLLGMSLMGGGLWGVGFVTVDMRVRKLLKRFLATPMRKTDFLMGIMISRMLFMVPEVLALLVFARYAFGVVNHGNMLAVTFLILLGAVTFSGIGLLAASRAKTIEAVSGIMNLVMVPMWIFSGIFFSSERFPEAVQPFIKDRKSTRLN